MSFVPTARSAVKGAYSVRIAGPRLLLQDIREKLMVAIPLTPVVERDDEKVSSFQVFQDPLPIAFARDGIAQRAAESVENRGSQEEAPDVLGLGLQYLFDEIVGDGTVVAGEGVE